jgi:ribosomal protein S27AE
MTLESIPPPAWAIVIAVVTLAIGLPVRCNHPTSKPPFRGCKWHVYGFLGKCPHHGRVPGVRLMASFGGRELMRRRTCDRCGQPRVFARHNDTGRAYLGCTRYPVCKNSRLLGQL